jgi:hypothetical protein
MLKMKLKKKMEKRTLYKLVVYDKNDNLTACII